MEAVSAPTDSRVSSFWGDPAVDAEGDYATVTVRIVYRVPTGGGGIQQDTEWWTLFLEHQDGWRVCGLNKDLSLDP